MAERWPDGAPKMALDPCPYCGYEADAAINPSVDPGHDRHPGEGDVSICAHCVGPSIFTAAGTRRLPTSDEMKEILADPRVQQVIRNAYR